MKRGKKAQFYLIAAAIIVILIITLSTVYNVARVNKDPKKMYSLTDVLETEAFSVIDYSLYNKESVSNNTNTFLKLFGEYLNENTNENILLVFIYGNITDNKLFYEVYGRSSQGEIRLDIGGDQIVKNVTRQIMQISSSEIEVIEKNNKKFIDITIEGVEYKDIPVLDDNNFLFILSSQTDLNKYITSNIYDE